MMFRKGSTERLTFLKMSTAIEQKTIFPILILKLSKDKFCIFNTFIFSLR